MIDSVAIGSQKDNIDKIVKILLERCNIRKLNRQGQTPVYFASKDRVTQFGWEKEVSVVLKQSTFTKSEFQPSASYSLIANLVKQNTRSIENPQVTKKVHKKLSTKASVQLVEKRTDSTIRVVTGDMFDKFETKKKIKKLQLKSRQILVP